MADSRGGKITRVDRWRNKVGQDIVVCKEKTEEFCKQADRVLSRLHEDLALSTDEAEVTDERLLHYIKGFGETCKAWEQNILTLKMLLDSFTFHMQRIEALGLNGVTDEDQHMEAVKLKNGPSKSAPVTKTRARMQKRGGKGSEKVDAKGTLNKDPDDKDMNAEDLMEKDSQSNVFCIMADGESAGSRFSSSTYIVMSAQDKKPRGTPDELVKTLQENLQGLAKEDLIMCKPKRVTSPEIPERKAEGEVGNMINRMFSRLRLKRSFFVKSSPTICHHSEEDKESTDKGESKSTQKITTKKEVLDANNSAQAQDYVGGFEAQSKENLKLLDGEDSQEMEDLDSGMRSKKNLACALLNLIVFDEMVRQDRREYERKVLRQQGSRIPLLKPLNRKRPWKLMKPPKKVVPGRSYGTRIPIPARNSKRKWLVA